MKLLAIDYGEKRVGLASTDEGGSFALPRLVVPNDSDLVERVSSLALEWGVSKVIMGESKNFKGEDNQIMAEARKFAEELESKGLEVVMHTEVLTSAEAKQIQGENEMLDASAAALILKSYIDSQKK
jgi:putative Holliday junction resolvase